MANATVTMSGLEEMRATVQALPSTVTAKLRAVAWRTSRRVRDGAMARLKAQTRTHVTADSIRVVEHADHHEFVVEVPGDPKRPANLPIWLEYGTVKMSARPSLRPALEAESATYIAESEAAVVAAAREVLA